MIKKILKKIEEETGYLAYPNLSSSSGNCIVYTYEPIRNDGIKKQDRLTIRIVAESIAELLDITQKVENVLITIGDAPKLEDEVLDCYLNGGGALYDNDTKKQHQLLYFYITSKSEVNL